VRGHRSTGGAGLLSKSEQLKGLLSRLRTVNGVDGAAVVSRDGLPVVVDLPASFDRETFSAMVAAMVGAAETALIEAGRGVPDRIILENKQTRILATGVSDQFLLVVTGRGDLNTEGLRTTIDSLAKELQLLTA
jgi:uncharacterized protein